MECELCHQEAATLVERYVGAASKYVCCSCVSRMDSDKAWMRLSNLMLFMFDGLTEPTWEVLEEVRKMNSALDDLGKNHWW